MAKIPPGRSLFRVSHPGTPTPHETAVHQPGAATGLGLAALSTIRMAEAAQAGLPDGVRDPRDGAHVARGPRKIDGAPPTPVAAAD